MLRISKKILIFSSHSFPISKSISRSLHSESVSPKPVTIPPQPLINPQRKPQLYPQYTINNDIQTLNIPQSHPEQQRIEVKQNVVVETITKSVVTEVDKEQEEIRKRLASVVSYFNAPIRFAFAYGSGVYKQVNSSGKTPLVDYIFAVKHPQHWHSLNLRQNGHHYSGIKHFGSKFLQSIQESSAGVYFNPYVTINNIPLKYGVISVDSLTTDLKSWTSLYTAGRMHKPIMILRNDARIASAYRANLVSAVKVALLLLPSRFTSRELYHTICSLSYRGDFRMVVGENPHKVYNIVYSQFEEFERIYSRGGVLDGIEGLERISGPGGGTEDGCEWSQDEVGRKRLIEGLPKALYERVVLGRGGQDESEYVLKISQSPDLPKIINDALVQTVRWTSITQSLKGLVTAGPLRSLFYVSEKLKKQITAQSANG
ncbi:Mitochondrial translocator assembly and maintenance protein 41 [Nowakowskiella sp. JEL0407]|nr:Mitochondrial translocator assembly and maintenance protein 41 [Nowakowskiella sp. JEL0407]